MKAFFNKTMVIAAIGMLFTTSCEKAFFEDSVATSNYKDNFDYFWRECDKKYAYFELKSVDWDLMYQMYSDSVALVNSDEEFFDMMSSLLGQLKDGHTNLISDFNVSYFGIGFQGQDNFDWRIVLDHYIGHNYYSTGPFIHNFIEDGKIAYIRFASFTGSMSNDDWDFMLNKYKDTEGLILDLRENGGGAISDVFSLIGHFIDTRTLVYHSRIRNGIEHNDFSDIEPAYAEPSNGLRYTSKKVAFLTDRGTYSAGSFTSLATKAIPNIILVGDTTGGGLGIPNGGQMPNGWIYRFSISQTLDLNQDESFETGVPPDVVCLFDWNDRTKDEVIDKAVEELLAK